MSLIVDYVGGGSSSTSLALGLNILSKPSKLFYIEGEHLNLDGLVIQFRNGASTTTIDGYITIPANGAELKRSDKFIKISYAIPDTNDIITDIIPIDVIYPVRLNIESIYTNTLPSTTEPISVEKCVFSLEYNDGYKEYILNRGTVAIDTVNHSGTNDIPDNTVRVEFRYTKEGKTFKTYRDFKVSA